jgi:hypothetical protein
VGIGAGATGGGAAPRAWVAVRRMSASTNASRDAFGSSIAGLALIGCISAITARHKASMVMRTQVALPPAPAKARARMN